jgi:hypothetical protein
MKDLLRIFFSIVFITLFMGVNAQGFDLVFHLPKKDSIKVSSSFAYERFYQTEQGRKQAVKYEVTCCNNSSFLTAGIDPSWDIGNKQHVNLFIGESITLIRLGGFSNLRGFDEESIYATSYGLINLEYRYLLGLNSFLQFFWNGAYIKNDATEIVSLKEDTPFGFGAGFSFETKGGIFNIAYALGRQQNNPIDFRTAKVHFGSTGYF